MEVRIEVEMAEIKGGWLARTPKLKLARAGESESQALSALKQTVMAYCAGLKRGGILLPALQRKGVEVTGDADGEYQFVLLP